MYKYSARSQWLLLHQIEKKKKETIVEHCRTIFTVKICAIRVRDFLTETRTRECSYQETLCKFGQQVLAFWRVGNCAIFAKFFTFFQKSNKNLLITSLFVQFGWRRKEGSLIKAALSHFPSRQNFLSLQTSATTSVTTWITHKRLLRHTTENENSTMENGYTGYKLSAEKSFEVTTLLHYNRQYRSSLGFSQGSLCLSRIVTVFTNSNN